MQLKIMVNTGSSMALVETVTMDDAVWQELRDTWNLALETGSAAYSTSARLAEVNHRILADGGALPGDGMTQLADLMRAVALHHSAVLEFRR